MLRTVGFMAPWTAQIFIPLLEVLGGILWGLEEQRTTLDRLLNQSELREACGCGRPFQEGLGALVRAAEAVAVDAGWAGWCLGGVVRADIIWAPK